MYTGGRPRVYPATVRAAPGKRRGSCQGWVGDKKRTLGFNIWLFKVPNILVSSKVSLRHNAVWLLFRSCSF